MTIRVADFTDRASKLYQGLVDITGIFVEIFHADRSNIGYFFLDYDA